VGAAAATNTGVAEAATTANAISCDEAGFEAVSAVFGTGETRALLGGEGGPLFKPLPDNAILRLQCRNAQLVQIARQTDTATRFCGRTERKQNHHNFCCRAENYFVRTFTKNNFVKPSTLPAA
jgi:hypothetical protein